MKAPCLILAVAPSGCHPSPVSVRCANLPCNAQHTAFSKAKGGTPQSLLSHVVWIVAIAWLLSPSLVYAQTNNAPTTPAVVPPTAAQAPAADNSSNPPPVDLTNPISILQNASRILPGFGAKTLPTPATPQVGSAASSGGSQGSSQAGERTAGRTPHRDGSTTETSGGGGLSASLSIILLLTVLSIAPAMLVMCTSFTRIVIVLSLLRQAIGTQALPPSQVIIGLSLFLTFLIMAPTLGRINTEAIVPLQNNQIDEFVAWERAKQPLRDFMFAQIEYAGNWGDVYMILNYRGVDTSDPSKLKRGDVDMLSLVPAFVLSELKVAFLMGFRLYLPFLVIDMVISSILISMGMMMLPPVLISLPFKLLLFVLVDGWQLVAGSLLSSFAVPGVTT